MTRRLTLMGAIIALVGFAVEAAAHSGHTDWGYWHFDWEVKDGAGLALRNLHWQNESVIYKASLPVIRVRYLSGKCGPYADQITWDRLVKRKCQDGRENKVCQGQFRAQGILWLEISVSAWIGSYQIVHAWFLSENGVIQARLFSRGLQCRADHDHHPYWRIHADVNGAGNDQILVFDNTTPDEGFGVGWHKHATEFDENKQPATARTWMVRDHPGGHGMWLFPGAGDGTADGFSNRDVSGRLYKQSEDGWWAFGKYTDLLWNEGEDIQEKDVVLWYVCHLHHAASGGGGVWHWCGPDLVLVPPRTPPPVLPTRGHDCARGWTCCEYADDGKCSLCKPSQNECP